MNRSFSCLGGIACLVLLVFASGCDDDDSLLPDVQASFAAVSRHEAPGATRSPERAPEAAPAAPVPAVVTPGAGAVCTTFADGITTCAGANGSTTRIAALF